MKLVFNQTTTGEVTRKTHKGREYLIVPVVALVEGVVNNQLALADEFGAFPEAWNGIPLVLGHPEQRGIPISANSPDIPNVGRLYEASIDGSKLKGNMWVDLARAEEAGEQGQKMVARFETGDVVNVSTAYFCDFQAEPGIFNNVSYAGIQRNMRPDHLAILLDQVGACSLADGCGAPRVNAQEGDCSPSKGEVVLAKLGQIIHLISLWENKFSRKEKRMKDQLIADLVANERCPLTAEELEGFEPERLQQLADAFAPTDAGVEDETAGDSAGTEDAVGETQDGATIGDGPSNADMVARLDAIEARLNANANQEKADLIASLVANERCPLETEALQKLGVPELKALAGSYTPADYSGRGGFRSQQVAGDLVEAPMPETE